MAIKRLRIGTKVKIIGPGPYREVGDIGFLCQSFSFHDQNDLEKVLDEDGYYWIDIPNTKYGCKTITNNPNDFKVLKY